MSNNVVPVSECDYLEEDPEIRGQKFCCVSFISPEKILDNKNTFIFTEFTKNFCKDMNELFHNMKEKYPDDADGFQAIADRYNFYLINNICKMNINTFVKKIWRIR